MTILLEKRNKGIIICFKKRKLRNTMEQVQQCKRVHIQRELSSLRQIGEDIELFIKYRETGCSDKGLRNLIATRNHKLVIYVVNCFFSKRKEYRSIKEDLIQEGCFGLLSAIDRFEPSYGCRFSTYAINWIRQSISSYLMTVEPFMVIPVSIRSLQNKSTTDELTGEIRVKVEENKRKPSKKTMEKIRDAMNADSIVSAEDVVLKNFVGKFSCLLDEDTITKITTKELNEAIQKTLLKMNKKNRVLLLMRYGIIEGVDEDVKQE